MRKLLFVLAIIAIVAVSCQREFNEVVDYTPSSESATDDYCTIRSYDEALLIAEDALNILGNNETRGSKKRTIKRNDGQIITRALTRSGESSEDPILYIFNNEDDAGFTIIAASKSVNPVVAVTESGNYNYGEPTGVESFDAVMDNVISNYSLILPPIDITPRPEPEKIDTVVNVNKRVEPMLQTNWGQSGIYGKYCSNGLSGCVNTALVQIMAYHAHPQSLIFTFMGHVTPTHIPWNSMTRHTMCSYGTINSDQEYVCYCGCNYEKIAQVMREVGERTQTDYKTDELGTTNIDETGSETDMTDALNALRLLGYANSKQTNSSTYSSRSPLIYAELDANTPVIMNGVRYDTINNRLVGHAWVIDGYSRDELTINYYIYNNLAISPGNPTSEYILDHTVQHSNVLFHINWGWDGSCNGWFDQNCFKTNEAVDYDHNHNTVDNSINCDFLQNIKLIYDINPTY